MGVGVWKALRAGGLVAVLAQVPAWPGAVAAATVVLDFDGGTASGWVTITAAPVETASGSLPMSVGAYGLRMTDVSGQMGSFTAFCLDISRWLQPTGGYEATATPFSNSYPIGVTEMARLQAVFDANFDRVSLGNAASAAGFQVALWNALYDTDWLAGSGRFAVTGGTLGATARANEYLLAASAYAGGKRHDMTFLEAQGYNQNLVTVAPVPLPAAGGMLAAALMGLAVLRRRRLRAR